MDYTIRPYQEKDRARVESICLSPEKAGTDAPHKQNGALSQVLLTAFCRYYLEQEPHNCFVAADEQDRAVGYILCAADFQTWKQTFTKRYLDRGFHPITKAVGQGTIKGLEPFSAEYPAHLHIDIAGSCQRQGLGTRLMDALLAHLKELGMPGVMLSVEVGNEKGIRFYQKYGFRELGRSRHEITMGKKLAGSAPQAKEVSHGER